MFYVILMVFAQGIFFAGEAGVNFSIYDEMRQHKYLIAIFLIPLCMCLLNIEFIACSVLFKFINIRFCQNSLLEDQNSPAKSSMLTSYLLNIVFYKNSNTKKALKRSIIVHILLYATTVTDLYMLFYHVITNVNTAKILNEELVLQRDPKYISAFRLRIFFLGKVYQVNIFWNAL